MDVLKTALFVLLMFICTFGVFIGYVLINGMFCFKHFTRKIYTYCSSPACNHMINYCPDCLDEMDYKFDKKSGCEIHREGSDKWKQVPTWKKEHINKEEMQHKLRKLGL
jgi:hypothetical protein